MVVLRDRFGSGIEAQVIAEICGVITTLDLDLEDQENGEPFSYLPASL
jgi:hypothetical protein